jgi:hypothetical protein
MSELRDLLLKASSTQLDARMRPLIEEWSDPPWAIEILEVLDYCIRGSLASGFIVATLQLVYDSALQTEGTTHEAMLPLATWRGAS